MFSKKLLVVIASFTVLLLQGRARAQRSHDTESMIVALAPTASDAVIPITFWTDHWNGKQPNEPILSGVVGTGFLVNKVGDFITAAHVLDVKQVGPPTHRIDVRLTATIRQQSGDGASVPFDIVEIDRDHDLALCHIQSFKTMTFANSSVSKMPLSKDEGALTAKQMAHPFASLALATSAPVVGRFVMLSGFPLGSWTPTIQLGVVSATHTVYPQSTPVAGVPKERAKLLQISINGNHGNSGGPVIDLDSGKVIGVLLQIVPAPLTLGGQQLYDGNSFAMSGIMLAAPAEWVQALLTKNHVTSRATRSGELVIW